MNIESTFPDNWITDEKLDVQYNIFVENDNKRIVIVFQGSHSAVDWKLNFTFITAAYKEMKDKFYFHKGFKEGYHSVNDNIKNLIKKYIELNPTYKIYITGFSLGGAYAQLCAEDIWYSFPELRDKLCGDVFGSPKFLFFWNSKKFAERIQFLNLYRNGSDIVPSTPPICFGFVRIKKLIQIGEKWNFFKMFLFTKYHSPAHYRDSMKDI
jgi:predicted lipase